MHALLPFRLSVVSSGYYAGKLMAESAAQQYATGTTTSVCLKPAVVFGTRYAGEAQVPVPLWMVFQPLRFVMRLPPVESVVAFLRTKMPYVDDAECENGDG